MKAGFDWAAAAAARHGEVESGDRFAVVPRDDGLLVAVVDGLGHGCEAWDAATRAVRTIRQYASESVLQVMQRCHGALVGTRGAVMSVAVLRPGEATLTWAGIGNVEGVLLRSNVRAQRDRESLVARAGVVGDRFLRPIAAELPIHTGDTLIFATDGIGADFERAVNRAAPLQRTADRILAEHGKKTDDALVLVARYLGQAGHA